MTVLLAAASAPPSMILRGAKQPKTALKQGRRHEVRVLGNFSHFGDTVRKDFGFLKKGIAKGVDWANEALHLPKVFKTLDDVLWLKNLEDHHATPVEPQSWPQPSYPGLTGVDLFMSDLKALEAYGSYFYYLSRIWSKPLPEVYDPQDVADYFSCRPHVVALRLLEVFSAFASATIRIRASGMQKSLRPTSEKELNGNISQYEFGLVLKETMLNLGPTFIKVGQSLSTRPDIIGTEISKALSELHDQIPPFPRNMAMKIIEEELGSVESVYRNISEEPIAAASFGQVYCANTLEGTKVAVKVQRPNLRHVVVRDIYILRLGLGLLQKIAKRKNDIRLYADELGKGLVGELDYTLEAANATKFLHAHSSFPFMRIPKVYYHLSGKRVLTMEWVDGESPSRLLDQSTSNSTGDGSAYSEREKIEAKRRLLDMVSKGVEATLIQLLETGLLHADPHAGNLRYISSKQIGFLDFGLLCQMEKKHQFAMLASIVHIVNGDWASLVQSLTEMDVIKPGTNIRLVTWELEDSLGEVVFRDGIPDIKFSRVLSKIWSVALKYHFRMPPYYTLVLRSLASFEGLAVAADPNFKTFEAAYPFVVRKLLTENSTETRRILHSVVFNKRKEFRWDRLALFLNVGSTRKVLTRQIAPKNRTSDGVFDVAHLMLMLSSKDGVVIRKLLMTADGASLVRAMVSKEAVFYRQQLCRVIADILHQCMVLTLGLGSIATRNSPSDSYNRELGGSSRLSISIYEYQSILKDRCLKVILSKILSSARKDPVLMLKLCWTSVVMFVTASALACHRVLVSLSEVYVDPLSLASKRVAVGG
ncbi:Protein kinase superfamily protein [Euphorbia peplus]|nr:Protein kinase superfamily protein [Euphorbia peplus]